MKGGAICAPRKLRSSEARAGPEGVSLLATGGGVSNGAAGSCSFAAPLTVLPGALAIWSIRPSYLSRMLLHGSSPDQIARTPAKMTTEARRASSSDTCPPIIEITRTASPKPSSPWAMMSSRRPAGVRSLRSRVQLVYGRLDELVQDPFSHPFCASSPCVQLSALRSERNKGLFF